MKSGQILNRLDSVFETIAGLPRSKRILLAVAALLLIGGGFYYLVYMPKSEKLKKLSDRHARLTRQLISARSVAGSKSRYEKKIKKARAEFEAAKAALPIQQEIPELLSDISRSGKEAGLEFLLFKPGKENRKDFFAEIPVEIRVVGGYHQVGVFFDKVSRLSRIVNIKDIDIRSEKNLPVLATRCKAVTYRFAEPNKKQSKNKPK